MNESVVGEIAEMVAADLAADTRSVDFVPFAECVDLAAHVQEEDCL
jgi:hypothetical protein